MGKHKRRRRDDAVLELSERIRELEKRMNTRRRHKNGEDSETCSSRTLTATPSRSRSPHDRSSSSKTRKRTRRERSSSSRSTATTRDRSPLSVSDISKSSKEGGGNVVRPAAQEDVPPIPETSQRAEEVTSLPDNIEGLLGQEGQLTTSNSFELHESIAKRWMAILAEGLNTDVRTAMLKKQDPPKNCSLLIPPKLNEEVAAAMNDSGIKRDKRISDQQTILSSAITTIGGVLNNMITTPNNAQHIEALSDSARLLCDLYHENSVTRRSLILPGLNKDMKDLMDQTPISEYLFGDKLQDKVNACKAVKKSGQELKNTPAQPKLLNKPKGNLNFQGPQRPQRPRPSGQKPKPKQANYAAKRRSKRSPPRQHHYQRRRGQERR